MHLKTKLVIACCGIAGLALTAWLLKPQEKSEVMSLQSALAMTHDSASGMVDLDQARPKNQQSVSRSLAALPAALPNETVVKIDSYSERVLKRFSYGKVLLTKDSSIDRDGNFAHQTLLKTDFKYPQILMTENWHVGSNGQKELLSRTAIVADHVLVGLSPQANIDRFSQFIAQNNWTILKKMPASGLYIVKFDASQDPLAIDSALAKLREQSDMVKMVAPDAIAFN